MICAHNVWRAGGWRRGRARVVLLRVDLATLRILLHTEVCTINGQERVALLDRK